MDCIFCKIANGEIGSDLVYEDSMIAAFNDLDPQAPVHILIVPKKHIASLNDLEKGDEEILGHLMSIIAPIAEKAGVASSGYRVVINTGKDGGQTVGHLHIHLLGKRKMEWPAG